MYSVLMCFGRIAKYSWIYGKEFTSSLVLVDEYYNVGRTKSIIITLKGIKMLQNH